MEEVSTNSTRSRTVPPPPSFSPPASHSITIPSAVASDTNGKARGGGYEWEALINLLLKGPELMKAVIQMSAAAFLTMFLNKNESLPVPAYYSAMTFSLGIAFLLSLASYFFFYKPNLPYGRKLAAIIGLIGLAFMTVTVPIASTYFLPTVYAVLTWICFVLLVIVVCGSYLLPFPVFDLLRFPKRRRSGSTKEDRIFDQESIAAENGDLDAVTPVSIATDVGYNEESDQPGLDPKPIIIKTSTPIVLQNEVSSACCSTKVLMVQVRKPAVVGFVLGANPPLKVMNGFFRRVWRYNGIDNISVLPNGIFVVEFFTYSQALKAAEGRQLMFDDSKHVITKLWEPDLILEKEVMIPATVSIWIQLPSLELKYWKPNCISKLARLVGKPVKIELGRVLVVVNLNHQLSDWIYFEDESGVWRKQKVYYVWKPVFCESCNNFGHGGADCRKRSGAPKKMWVVKTSDPVVVVAPNITGLIQLPELVGEVHNESVIKTADKGKSIWVGS